MSQQKINLTYHKIETKDNYILTAWRLQTKKENYNGIPVVL